MSEQAEVQVPDKSLFANVKDSIMANWKISAVVVICIILIAVLIWYMPEKLNSISPFKSSLETEIDELIEKIESSQKSIKQ